MFTPHLALQRNAYFVKEHVGLFKAAHNFDLLDPSSREKLLECREPRLGFLTRLLRFSDLRRMLPFDIDVLNPRGGETVVNVRRGFTLFRSQVEVRDGQGALVAHFKQRLFSMGGRFDITSPSGEALCTLRGRWAGWDFKFERQDRVIARITKQWAGAGRELFTSADQYIIAIEPEVSASDPVRHAIVAAALCIDMVFKE